MVIFFEDPSFKDVLRTELDKRGLILEGEYDRGANGIIYTAQDIFRKIYAIKVFKTIGDEVIIHFNKDLSQLRRLHHQNIVKLKSRGHFTFQGKEIYYLVLEFFQDSENLKKINHTTFLQEKIQTRANYALQLASGLLAIHQIYNAHNDLHEGNVLISASAKLLKIIDPGAFSSFPGGSGSTDIDFFRRLITSYILPPEDLKIIGLSNIDNLELSEIHQILQQFINPQDRQTQKEVRKGEMLIDVEKIHKFRSERVRITTTTANPVDLGAYPRIILHALPVNSFRRNTGFDISQLEDQRILNPMYSSRGNYRPNFDGLLMFTTYGNTITSYVQVFHNGCIEWAEISMLEPWEGEKIYSYGAIEPEIIKTINQAFRFFRTNNIEPPIFFYLTLLKIKGYHLPVKYSRRQGVPLDRDEIVLPDLIVESLDENPNQIVKLWFDRIWNSFGIDRDPCFNAQGIWDKNKSDRS